MAASVLMVFSVAGGAFGSALAFQVAGLIMLAGVGVAVVLRGRRTTAH